MPPESNNPFKDSASNAKKAFSSIADLNQQIGRAKRIIQIASTFINLLVGAVNFFIAFWLPILVVGTIFGLVAVGGLITGNEGSKYLVPSLDSVGTGQTSHDILGSCPIPGGNIECGILGGTHYCQHGSNEYWSQFSQCSWAIPVTDTACFTNNIFGNVCDNGNTSCYHYGMAADFRYSGNNNGPVHLPYIKGERLHWIGSGSGPGCGYHITYRATSQDGTAYEIFFEHLGEAALGEGMSGDMIASSMHPGGPSSCVIQTHVHVELRQDGVFTNPEPLCTEAGSGGLVDASDLSGWIITSSNVSESNLVGTNPNNPGEMSTTTCQWAQSKGLQVAVNSNYFTTTVSPDGHVGYLGNFTNYAPLEGFQKYNFTTLTVDQNNKINIDPHHQLPNSLPSGYKFAVSGVNYYDNVATARARTLVGTRGSEIVVVVLKSATPGQADSLMNSLGVTNGFSLDGGGSTTLCENGNQIFPSGAARVVATSFGFHSAKITPLN